MRTEVKIGIAIGAVLAIIIVGWIGVAAMNKKPDAQVVANNAAPDNNINVIDLLPSTTSAPVEPIVGEPVVLPTDSTIKPSVVASTAAPVEPTDSSRLKIDWGDTGIAAKPAATTEPDNSANTRTYVVETGDSLWRISEQMYGNGSRAGMIKEANKLESNALRVGQKLTIPPLPSKVASPGSDTPAAEPDDSGLVTSGSSASARTYTVVAGDAGLYAIAKKVYGDGSKWDVIAKANHGIRSEALKVGQKLIIPTLDGKAASTSKPASANKTTNSGPSKAAPAKHSEEPSNRPIFE